MCVRSKIKKKIKKHIRYCVKLNINIYIYKPNWPKPNNSQPNKTQLEPNKTLTLTPIKSINQYPTNQTSTHTLSLKLYFFFFIPKQSNTTTNTSISGALPIPTPGTDRANVNISFGRNWELLQNRYVGTGHPDITKYEWIVNHHRDTLASHLGHADHLAYFATAEGETIGRIRYTMLERMLQPVGYVLREKIIFSKR